MNRFAIALSLLLLSICAYSSELFPNRQPKQFSIADQLENDATIGGYQVWNGEGKWRLYELTRTESLRQTPLGTAALFQTENKKFVAAMEVYANLESASGYWTEEPCKREDMLFKKQLAGGRQDNCVTINHITRYMSNPSGKGIELYAMFKEQGVEFPPTALQIKITRNGTSSNKLAYTIYVNPEILGFPSEPEPNWSRNPWNKTMAYNDPAKKQFIDDLSTWALNFAKQMDDALRQKPDALSNIPSWRAGTEIKVKTEEVKVKKVLD
jgi:hypothetical protein